MIHAPPHGRLARFVAGDVSIVWFVSNGAALPPAGPTEPLTLTLPFTRDAAEPTGALLSRTLAAWITAPPIWFLGRDLNRRLSSQTAHIQHGPRCALIPRSPAWARKALTVNLKALFVACSICMATVACGTADDSSQEIVGGESRISATEDPEKKASDLGSPAIWKQFGPDNALDRCKAWLGSGCRRGKCLASALEGVVLGSCSEPSSSKAPDGYPVKERTFAAIADCTQWTQACGGGACWGLSLGGAIGGCHSED